MTKAALIAGAAFSRFKDVPLRAIALRLPESLLINLAYQAKIRGLPLSVYIRSQLINSVPIEIHSKKSNHAT